MTSPKKIGTPFKTAATPDRPRFKKKKKKKNGASTTIRKKKIDATHRQQRTQVDNSYECPAARVPSDDSYTIVGYPQGTYAARPIGLGTSFVFLRSRFRGKLQTFAVYLCLY